MRTHIDLQGPALRAYVVKWIAEKGLAEGPQGVKLQAVGVSQR